MDHEPVLLITITLGLTAALVGGLVARRLRAPAIVGYIVAGVIVGPFTPGPTADSEVATELAEIGVILLMFGVGIHFSIADLLSVRTIAIPGAVGQSLTATLLGIGLGVALGWGFAGGLVLGLALSVASTVVLLRALEDRGELGTPQGRIAIGWLIVEDLFTVVVLVLLPSIAPLLLGSTAAGGAGAASEPLVELVVALGRATIFAALMIVLGTRLVPRLLLLVARQHSRELFTLAVLAIALGLAFVAASLFGVSLALGAFLAGLVVSGSDTSHQASADALPLRDAFAVLFFVSVGMLLDPLALLANPWPVLVALLLVMVGKSVAAFGIVALFGYPLRTALTVSASLAQIGEFSFILGTAGLQLGLLPDEAFQLIVATALLSIALNPVAFRLVDPLERRWQGNRVLARLTARRSLTDELGEQDGHELRGHAILCGYDRIGRLVASALQRRGFRMVVVTLRRDEIDRARHDRIPAIYGDAANAETLERAHVHGARVIVVTTSDAFATRLIVERVRDLDPKLDLVVRTHSDAESDGLRAIDSRVRAVHAKRETAAQMTRSALRRFGVPPIEAEAIAQGVRLRGSRD